MVTRVMAAVWLLLWASAAGAQVPAGSSPRVVFETDKGERTRRAAAGQQPAAAPADPDGAVAAWRAKHEADYRRNFVIIAGLHELKPGINTAGSAAANDVVLPASTPATIGRFIREGPMVRFDPAPGAPVLLRGRPVTTAIELRDDSTPETDELVLGDVRLVVHRSGANRTIRVRDPNGKPAREFAGFAWFPIDSTYRVTARLIRDAEPRRLKVLNTYGDADDYLSEGVVEFRLSGQTLRLRPFTTRPGRLYFVFRDASSGQETYETARFLYSDLRDDGTTVLDFNMAYNPPCAFNPYTTCPIPLKENRLPVKILAGEKTYAGHHASGGTSPGVRPPAAGTRCPPRHRTPPLREVSRTAALLDRACGLL